MQEDAPLTSRVCDNIDERAQRLVGVCVLGETLANLLNSSCNLCHVHLQKQLAQSSVTESCPLTL